MELLQVYGCSYCSMVSRRKGSVSRHESTFCRKNPNRVTCGNCKHMSHEEGSKESLDSGQTIYHDPSWYCLGKDEDLSDAYGALNASINCSKHELAE